MLEVNVNRGSSSKSDLQDYIDENSVEFPAIWHEEGGTDLATATGNGTSGNPKYMIYPDKTFSKTGTIPSSITEHIHTSSEKGLIKEFSVNAVSLCALKKNEFSITVSEKGIYSFSFYSATGQLQEKVQEKSLSAGSHRMVLNKGVLANGIYFVKINNGREKTKKKVMVNH